MTLKAYQILKKLNLYCHVTEDTFIDEIGKFEAGSLEKSVEPQIK